MEPDEVEMYEEDPQRLLMNLSKRKEFGGLGSDDLCNYFN